MHRKVIEVEVYFFLVASFLNFDQRITNTVNFSVSNHMVEKFKFNTELAK